MTIKTHHQLFLKAVARIFVRLARAAMARGVSFQELSSAFREATLAAARQSLIDESKKVTTTALHVATGIHRKEIARWLKENDDPERHAEALAKPGTVSSSATARIIAHWISDATYLDQHENPLPLPFEAEDSFSFQGMVEKVSVEVRARGVLSAMEAAGLIEADADGLLHLKSTAYLPALDEADSYEFLQDNVGDHLAAALHNTSGEVGDKRHFERALFHSGLSEKEIIKLEKQIETAGMSFLRKMLTRVNAAEERDSAVKQSPNLKRFRIGVYAFNEDAEPEELSSQKDPEQDV